MKQEGLDGFEDHPEKILGRALIEYCKQDEGFLQKIRNYAMEVFEVSRKIQEDDPSAKESLEQFGKAIIEPKEISLRTTFVDKV